MKRFKEFINEGLLAAMKPVSDDKIIDKLSGLSVIDKLNTISENGLPSKYLPPINEILTTISEDDWFEIATSINDCVDNNNDTLRAVYDYVIKNDTFLNSLLPSGMAIEIVDGVRSLVFGEWANFVELIKSDSRDDYIKGVLSLDNIEVFYNYSKYSDGSDEDVDDETLQTVKDKINDILNKEDFDYDTEEYEDLSDISGYYNFCKTYDIDEVVDAIDNAYSDARASADESEAYEDITDKICNKFNLKKEVGFSGDKYCSEIIGELFSFEMFTEGLDSYDKELILLMKFDTPYNGYHGDIDEVSFSEFVDMKIDEIE